MGFTRPFVNLLKIIKFHGGLINTFKEIYYVDSVKMGNLVGEDQYGNRYYENTYYFVPRNRWVIYSRQFGLDYDASNISCEYFNWLHHTTDVLPCYDSTRPCYSWMMPHTGNQTGTEMQYVPYDTTKPRIQPWRPKPILDDDGCPIDLCLKMELAKPKEPKKDPCEELLIQPCKTDYKVVSSFRPRKVELPEKQREPEPKEPEPKEPSEKKAEQVKEEKEEPRRIEEQTTEIGGRTHTHNIPPRCEDDAKKPK